MIGFKRKFLSKSNEPYYISEIGINHNGKLKIALELIKQSKDIGCSAVKFQKRDTNDLLELGTNPKEPNGYLSKNSNDMTKINTKFGKWVYPDVRLELSKDDYTEIKRYCKKIKIDLIITPWDEASVDFILKLGVKSLKIASIDANNHHFCNYVAKKRFPTIISTGMCTMDELIKTKKIFKKYNAPHMFLHCTSAYPSESKDKNLLCIGELKKILNSDIGFSGHGTGFIGTAGSIALGCEVIEKHITLNKKMSGPDHAASLDLIDFKNAIIVGNEIKKALGQKTKKFLKSEKVLNSILLRHLSARKLIRKNDKINYNNIKPVLTDNKKGSIIPSDFLSILGKKPVREIRKGEILKYKLFKRN